MRKLLYEYYLEYTLINTTASAIFFLVYDYGLSFKIELMKFLIVLYFIHMFSEKHN